MHRHIKPAQKSRRWVKSMDRFIGDRGTERLQGHVGEADVCIQFFSAQKHLNGKSFIERWAHRESKCISPYWLTHIPWLPAAMKATKSCILHSSPLLYWMYFNTKEAREDTDMRYCFKVCKSSLKSWTCSLDRHCSNLEDLKGTLADFFLNDLLASITHAGFWRGPKWSPLVKSCLFKPTLISSLPSFINPGPNFE